ncbi:hypothetical protein FG379_003081 [Cryptosporidium bovis]|uniref:uncharacterized protein n=1 Tax=Cryptosporidium bovis TaxID=310047 RepID=UPI003519E1D7|nr:hypothetical protein FG379_003081 [Cryptosporidium bovis]
MSNTVSESTNFDRLNQIKNSVNSDNISRDEGTDDSFLSYFLNYEKAKIVSNYFELSCLEYLQTNSSFYSNLDNDFSNVKTKIDIDINNKVKPLFLIMSYWKLLWCLTINELIGEVLRYKIETGRSFHIEGKDEISKYLSIPELTEGEVSRYIMAYSPIFRVVLGVLRWLRWESRVNPEKQNDVLVKDTYFTDYQESRILNKSKNGQKRFYHLDWGISSEIKVDDISKKDSNNIEEVFRISYLLLRKGCRMQLDTFLQENARANWIICLIDGMDAYLNSEKYNDYYVDLSCFLDILPKVDDMWLNENEDENELIFGVNDNENNGTSYSMQQINKDLALNDTLFKESFEFLDLIERSLIFPSIEETCNHDMNENKKNSDCHINNCSYSSIIEGNVNRIILYHFLKNIVSHDVCSNTSSSNIGNWEKTFYSLLCGEFNNLYNNSKDDYDKLFALFNTKKINIFNNWSDFLENNTQKGRNGVFRGKYYPSNSIFKSIYNRVKLMTKNIHCDIKSDYITDDFDDMQEFVNIDNFQRSYNFDHNSIHDNKDEYNEKESRIYYNDHYKNIIKDMVEAERQSVDSLIDSMSYINVNKENSIDCLFFNIYVEVINSFLNPVEYNIKFMDSLKSLLKFISNSAFEMNKTLSQDLSYTGSIRAFLAQIIVSNIEIMNSLSKNNNSINNYKVHFFDEYLICSYDDNNNDKNDDSNYYLNIPSFELNVFSTVKYPFLSIPESFIDGFISQYLNYIIESKKDYEALDMFLLMLEYTSLECRISYIREIILRNKNHLNLTNFQRIIYNLVTQFPSETIEVTFDFIEIDVYNRLIENKVITNFSESENDSISNDSDIIILEIEFVILILGTIFQFLIIRQEYTPSIDTIYKVVKKINDLNYKKNNNVLSKSLLLLENDIVNENQCNQTIYEVVVGIFILSEISNLSQLLFTLETLSLIGNKGNLESIQNTPQLLTLKRTNTCLSEFIIPMVLEPIVIRLFTVIASNIDKIEPKYTNYKINQILKLNNFLQAINWEDNIVYLASISGYIKINNLLVTFFPLKNIISQINYFKALSLIKNYQDLIEDFKNNVDNIVEYNYNINDNVHYYNQQIFKSDNNFETKNYNGTDNSPKGNILTSPLTISNLSSSRHNSQRRSSLQLSNIEKQINSIECKINDKIKDIECMLKNWLISIPDNTILDNSDVDQDKTNKEISCNKFANESTVNPCKLFFGYCHFPNEFNFKSNLNNVQYKSCQSLLETSRSVNIKRLIDQLVFTIIFHHDVICYYTNKLELINNSRKSLNSIENDNTKTIDCSLIFLDKLLKFIDNSDWIQKQITRTNSIK